MLPSLFLCHPMFKGSKKFTSVVKTTFVSVPFESVRWLRYPQHSKFFVRVLYHRCGIHHAPASTRLFMSTSTHHPGISLRNKFITLRSVCLNDRFSHFRYRFTSLTFDWNIRLSVWHQIIYSHSRDCTRVPWESLAFMVISLVLVNGSHHWLVIKWFLPCSTSNISIHMDRIALSWEQDEDPRCSLSINLLCFPSPGLQWNILYDLLHGSTLYVGGYA